MVDGIRWRETRALKESSIRNQDLRKSDLTKAETILNHLNRISTYHFHNTDVNSPLNQPSRSDMSSAKLRPKGQNIAGFIKRMKEVNPQRYKVLTYTIRSIAPYFLDFTFETIGEGENVLYWHTRYSDQTFMFTDFSDGTQRFVALCCVFLQEDLPGTIILDEPELGLHPTAIAKLVGLMRSAVGRGTQIVAATQSSEMIDYFAPEEVVTTDLQKGATVFQRLDRKELSEWLKTYSLGDLWSQSIISEAQVQYRHE